MVGYNSAPINEEIVSCRTWQEVLNVALKRCEQMDELNIVTALHRTAKLWREEDGGRTPAEQVRSTEGVRCLLKHVWHFTVRCRPQQLANSIWACAVLQIHETDLLDRICQYAAKRASGYTSQNMANTMWALGALSHQHEELLNICLRYAEAQVKEFSPQDLANTCWAFARLQRPCEKLFQLLLHESILRLHEFQAQNMSNLVWACATILHHDEPAMRAIASYGLQYLEEFSTQEISNLTWGLGTLLIRHEEWLDASAAAMARRSRECCPQDLSNTIWAYGTLEYKRNEHLRAINWEVMRQIEHFSPQGLSNVIWGLSAIEYRDIKTLTCISEEVLRRPIEQLTPPDISTLLYSFAVLAWSHEAALAKLRRAVRHWLPRFASRDVANCSWAFVILSHRDDEIFRAMHLRAAELMEEFNVQGLCNIAWAFVRFGLDVPAKTVVGIAEETIKRQEELLEEPGDAVMLSDSVCSEWSEKVPPSVCAQCDAIGRIPYARVFDFLKDLSNIPLPDSPAAEVERYQNTITGFGTIQLGRRLTMEMLRTFGCWEDARERAVELRGLREQWLIDEWKTMEATDATLAHKTTCTWTLEAGNQGVGEKAVLASGSPMGCDVRFTSCIVDHPRASDAEFQVLNKAADRLLRDPGQLHGSCLRMDVSEIPCLSCLGAIRQFQKTFPMVSLKISFSIRKVLDCCVDKSSSLGSDEHQPLRGRETGTSLHTPDNRGPTLMSSVPRARPSASLRGTTRAKLTLRPLQDAPSANGYRAAAERHGGHAGAALGNGSSSLHRTQPSNGHDRHQHLSESAPPAYGKPLTLQEAPGPAGHFPNIAVANGANGVACAVQPSEAFSSRGFGDDAQRGAYEVPVNQPDTFGVTKPSRKPAGGQSFY
eukprot:TRINITY_DN74918_c0_g1_i1.p1 TRINITY_DN74918_c0_g1~~TRINITY_DN74918_c0_g1_i1.p1  ORF type:complete len:883 (-),score=172.66 TRINITY_DN74918_c0_g1_i1:444-3092(-)